ncbi:MAG: hypothetical protein ACK4Z5_08165 [Brevundimonas sp.]
MGAEEALIDDDDMDEGEIVEWYAARPVTVSTAAASGAILGAFALGVVATVGVLILSGRLDD